MDFVRCGGCLQIVTAIAAIAVLSLYKVWYVFWIAVLGALGASIIYAEAGDQIRAWLRRKRSALNQAKARSSDIVKPIHDSDDGRPQ